MCLITEQLEPLEALEDIICYKVVIMWEEKISSPHNTFIWELNKPYTTNLKHTEEGYSLFCNDIDSKYYKNKYKGMLKKNNIDYLIHKGILISIAEGFHAVLFKPEDLEIFSGDALFECIIPKGALYYKNEVDFIVADTIKLIKEVQIDSN